MNREELISKIEALIEECGAAGFGNSGGILIGLCIALRTDSEEELNNIVLNFNEMILNRLKQQKIRLN